MSTQSTGIRRHQNKRQSFLMKAYATFIDSLNWHFFGTLTFRDSWSQKSIRRAIERHLCRLRPRSAFWVLEEGSDSSNLHLHVLYYFGQPPGSEPPKSVIERDWYVNGIAQIDAFDPSLNGSAYICKTVSHAPDYDLWLSTDPLQSV